MREVRGRYGDEANSLVFVDDGAAEKRQTCGCGDDGGSCGFHRGLRKWLFVFWFVATRNGGSCGFHRGRGCGW